MPIAADGERARDEAETGGCGDAERDRRDRLEAPDFRGVRADVARKPEEHRVAEREQVDVADQEIEGAGEQREAERLHDEERIGDERRDRDQRDHHCEGDPAGAAVAACRIRRGDGGLGSCQAALPNRPAGRINRTIAMMTNTTVFDASG